MQLGNWLASSEYRKFVSNTDLIPDEDAVHPPKIPTNIPPLGDGVTNSDKAIATVLDEDDARYPTVTQASTANQSSASTQTTKYRQTNPNCDSLRNLNVDDDVVMKGCMGEIPDISVASLSIDGIYIKCDVCKTGGSLGMINMRHPNAIRAWTNHLGTAGHKEGIIACEKREQEEALGGDIPNDDKQQQLTLASFSTVKGAGSRFARPAPKKKKRGRTDTEKRSGSGSRCGSGGRCNRNCEYH